MTNKTLNTDAIMFITPRPELVMVQGEGSWLTDQNGKRYLDFMQGWALRFYRNTMQWKFFVK